MGDKGSKDKGKREQQKKAQLSPKEKRRLKKEKKNKNRDTKGSAAPESTPVDKKNMDKAEKKIIKLEQEKKDLEAIMSAPEFYNGDNQKVTEAQDKYDRKLKDLKICETAWLEAQGG